MFIPVRMIHPIEKGGTDSYSFNPSMFQECTPGLLAGAAAGLAVGGRLFVYGPFALSGLLAPQSNRDFDESLKARSDGVWGIKDVVWVAELGDKHGLELTEMTPMPANNFFVVFTKV